MPDESFKPVGLDRKRLFALMKERNLDGIFLSSPENVFYTTGFPTLSGSGNPIVYADSAGTCIVRAHTLENSAPAFL